MKIKRVNSDEIFLAALCFAYCEAKGIFWNLFFGLRRIDSEGWLFLIKERDFLTLIDIVENFDG